ncbi:outer membrane lipoprotein-sorting protein [Bdellovibrio sp. KM01]|uniref:outer membrane lipoprotein-sorting protein n=1 Tax=Bdellovibrio sp. KM01 TaxID=2748865 RepID=UPI0015E9AD3A|nr:outer membrane lipoprotein-sorting protein [Bdellovibrio sp. KM01]QLY25575.1 outer membrane lipoprotein-sorting protein [Bdellovibrio sp. KM01]
MKILKAKLIIFGLVFSALSANAASPEQMVQAADKIRNPSDSYEMQIQVETPEGTSVFDVSLKGQDKTMIITKEPARDKGRNMLMLDRDFHAYIPNLKRSMRLSLAQKLSGQVANGDISRTRWAGDYNVTKESENANEVQLLLKGSKENLTYAWIRLWLKKSNAQPLRADYLGLDGKTVLKRASFEDYKSIAGAVRPTTIKIQDVNKQVSYIRIKSMKPKTFDDGFFTTRNMESMK